MGSKYLVLAAFLAPLAMAGAAQSASQPGPDAPREGDAQVAAVTRLCNKLDCRKSVRNLSLTAAGGKTVEASTERYPYIDDQGAIVIYPGETIGTYIAEQGDAFGKPALASVAGLDGPVKLDFPHADVANLTFKFEEVGKGKPGMFLTLDSHIDAVIKYNLLMFVSTPKGYRAVPTSSCTLLPPQPGMKTFYGTEHWLHPVLMLVITNIRALPKGSPMMCE